jgi:hypothetical protein
VTKRSRGSKSSHRRDRAMKPLVVNPPLRSAQEVDFVTRTDSGESSKTATRGRNGRLAAPLCSRCRGSLFQKAFQEGARALSLPLTGNAAPTGRPLLVATDYPTTRLRGATRLAGSLIPRGSRPTTPPPRRRQPSRQPAPKSGRFRTSAISEVTEPSRRWCVTGALTRRRRVQYVKRLRTGSPCRASAKSRHRAPDRNRAACLYDSCLAASRWRIYWRTLARPLSRNWCGLTFSDWRNGAMARCASKSASA